MEYILNKDIHNALNKLLDPRIGPLIPQKHLRYLLRYISEQEEDLGATGCPKLDETFFIPWIKQAVDEWKIIGNNTLPINILIFTAELTTSMCLDEKTFIKLNFTGLLEMFISIIRSTPDPPNAGQIKLSYINLISSFLCHKSGIQWIMVTNYWFDIFTMISQSSSKEISDQSCDFIINLLEKSRNDNEMFCCSILEVIVSPIKDLAEDSVNHMDENVALTFSLSILKKIVEGILIKCCSLANFKLFYLFNEKFSLDKNLKDLVMTVSDPDLNFQLHKILLLVLNFSTSEFLIVNFNMHEMLKLIKKLDIIDILVNATYCHSAEKVLELIYVQHSWMKIICTYIKNKTFATGALSSMNHQMMLFILRPVHYFAMEILGMKEENADDELRVRLKSKIVGSLIPIAKDGYLKYYAAPIRFSAEDAALSLKCIISCSEFYSVEAANSAIQMVIYILVDILHFLKMKPEILPVLSQEFVLSLLETITTLLTTFDVTWQDSMETIYLTEIISHFLGFCSWSPQIVVKALELLNLGISKYLSPNMALLIDESHSETDIGKIVYRKISDKSPEVRNAAVQVVSTIVQKVKKKFDSYRKLIEEAGFPNLILKVASTDQEIAVRISAIQCLQEMATTTEIWSSLEKNVYVYDQILQLYYLQPDGLARCEAVTLFKELYALHQLSESVKEKFYDSMTYAVMEDQYNLVKIRSLKFWQQVIENHLNCQGMIDGKFPEMTFSKSSRKIVRFNETEIKKCLMKVLDQLSANGCLTVFLFCLNHSDDELRNHATNLIKKFIDVLKKYLLKSSNLLVCDPLLEPFLTKTKNDVFTQEIVKNHSSIMDVHPTLDDFCEDLLDLEELTHLNFDIGSDSSNSGTFSDSSNSGASNSSCDGDKENRKNDFLKFALNFDFYQKEEIRKREKLKDDFEYIIKQIMNL